MDGNDNKSDTWCRLNLLYMIMSLYRVVKFYPYEGDDEIGYLEMTDEQFSILTALDTQYSYIKVCVSIEYEEMLKQEIEYEKEQVESKEKSRKQYNKWLEDNPKEAARIKLEDEIFDKELSEADNVFERFEIIGKYKAKQLERSMIYSYKH